MIRAIDSLRLHPDAERVPMAGPDDLANLRASLAEHGQQDPIDIAGDVILDGRTRWSLLRDLGATTIQVRPLALPENQQTNYIVDRALARRHLTAEQKRGLNALLREAVISVVINPTTGEEMRIGQGATKRAEILGVERETVQRWDRDEAGVTKDTPAPTHQIYGDGRVRPIHLPPREVKPAPRRARPTPLRTSRSVPAWSRHFSQFCRRSRPEDHEFLLRMAREIHAALRQNDITYQED